MDLLHHGVDRSVIALWLGHEFVETTAMYLQADMQLKEQALAKTDVADVRSRRYKPDDHLLGLPEEPLIMPINWPKILRILRPPATTRNNPGLGIMPQVVDARSRLAWLIPQPDLARDLAEQRTTVS